MSRKILKIGTDIVTLTDKVVSVREDYPFWKVNLDTSEQYWNSFDAENTSVPYPLGITNTSNFSGQGFIGFVSCDGINHYSIPTSDASIKKFNTTTGSISYIGSLSGSNQYTSAIPVGYFIYFIPASATSVLKLDTRNDTLSFIGSLSGTTKWGRAVLLPDGRIFAPKNSATTHFTLNTSNDVITLINATNVGLSDQFEAGTWFYNGFVYGLRGASSSSGRVIKINVTTFAETIVSVGSGSNLYLGCAQYKNLVFIGCNTATSMAVWNNLNDTVSYLTIPSGANGNTTVRLHSDGWIYMLGSPLLRVNIRVNPKNLTVETVSVNDNTGGVLYLATVSGTNGKIYAFTGQFGNAIRILNPSTNVVVNTNKLLHRNINKI